MSTPRTIQSLVILFLRVIKYIRGSIIGAVVVWIDKGMEGLMCKAVCIMISILVIFSTSIIAQVLIDEDFSSLSDWSYLSSNCPGFILNSDGGMISVQSYGSCGGDLWEGIEKTISTPISTDQDFEVSFNPIVSSDLQGQMGGVQVELLSNDNIVVARLNWFEPQAGTGYGGLSFYAEGDLIYGNTTGFDREYAIINNQVRLVREGDLWSAWVGGVQKGSPITINPTMAIAKVTLTFYNFLNWSERQISINSLLILADELPPHEPELIAHWTFDEILYEDVIPDITGNGYNGVIEGFVSVEDGQIDNALDFNGIGRVRVPNFPDLSSLSEFTFTSWYNLHGHIWAPSGLEDQPQNYLFNRRGSISIGHGDDHYSEKASWLYGFVNTTDGSNAQADVGPTKPDLHRWYHMACVYDGTALSMYVDGQLKEQRAVQAPISSSEYDFFVGGWYNRFLNGLMDDARFYNYALSAEQINLITNTNNNPPISILRAYANGECQSLINFDASLSNDDDGEIVKYEIDFEGDGTFDVEFNSLEDQISYDYTLSSGLISPLLRVTDNGGRYHESVISIYLSGFQLCEDGYSFENGWGITDWIYQSPIHYFNSVFEGVSEPVLHWLRSNLLKPWLGLCSGMSSTTTDYYTSPSHKPFSTNVYSWEKRNSNVYNMIMFYHLSFNLHVISHYPYSLNDLQAIENELVYLKTQLSNNAALPLSVRWDGMFSGHALVAVGLIHNSDVHYQLICYDNNSSSITHTIDMYKGEETWLAFLYGIQISNIRFYDANIGASEFSIENAINAFWESLDNQLVGLYSEVLVTCPVDVILINDQGDTLGNLGTTQFNDIPGANLRFDSNGWRFRLPAYLEYELFIFGKDTGHVDIFISNVNTIGNLDIITYNIPCTGNSLSHIEITSEHSNLDVNYKSNENQSNDSLISPLSISLNNTIECIGKLSDVSGSVDIQDSVMPCIIVNLLNKSNNRVLTTKTDHLGCYEFKSIPLGDYVLCIIPPLGYLSNKNDIDLTLEGINRTVNFEVFKTEYPVDIKTRGFWAHQVTQAIAGNPKDYSVEELMYLVGLLAGHFNANEINPVEYFYVPQPATQLDSLEALKRFLYMQSDNPDDHYKYRKAKSQLITLMLNVAAQKVHQTESVTADGMTVAQAITYCDLLLDNQINVFEPNGAWFEYEYPLYRYVMAGYVLTLINNAYELPANMVPRIVDVVYRPSQETALPTEFVLHDNYPNPFNPTTTIKYSLPKASEVIIEVFNITGQRVVTLENNYKEVGEHSIVWNGKGESNQFVSSGIYFYRITAGEFIDTKKMTLLK